MSLQHLFTQCTLTRQQPTLAPHAYTACTLSLLLLQVVEVVLGLISDSLDSWRTRQYDYYQRVLNGIL